MRMAMAAGNSTLVKPSNCLSATELGRQRVRAASNRNDGLRARTERARRYGRRGSIIECRTEDDCEDQDVDESGSSAHH
jgi:hypothetical protein